MKALISLSLLIFLSQNTLAAMLPEVTDQQPIEQTLENTTNLENELKVLSDIIEEYYRDTLVLSEKLSKQSLKLTSPKTKMTPEMAQAVETLENTKLAIIDSFTEYRTQIEELALSQENRLTVENSKLLYDVALVKAFLPRYEISKNVGLISKILANPEAQFAEEIIKRADALNLFYTKFDTSKADETTKNALNPNFRVNELVKTHNAITDTFNKNRGSTILQSYPKHLKNPASEAALYQSIIKGETFDLNSSAVVSTCTGLFSL